MNKMKRQKDMTPEDEPPRSVGVQYASGEEQRANTNSSGKNEVSGPKKKDMPLVWGNTNYLSLYCLITNVHQL